MNPDRTKSLASCFVGGLLALIVAGHIESTAAQSTDKVPSGDPCTVVPLSDVQKAFPGAKAGVRDTRNEKYGITECIWKDAGGVVLFGVQEFYGSDSAMDETKGIGQAMVAGNMANARNVRYETLTGVGLGNDAVAFIEATDAKRGIVDGNAMLTLHRGQRTLWLTAPPLTTRDRAAALKTFEILGRIAIKRLD